MRDKLAEVHHELPHGGVHDEAQIRRVRILKDRNKFAMALLDLRRGFFLDYQSSLVLLATKYRIDHTQNQKPFRWAPVASPQVKITPFCSQPPLGACKEQRNYFVQGRFLNAPFSKLRSRYDVLMTIIIPRATVGRKIHPPPRISDIS